MLSTSDTKKKYPELDDIMFNNKTAQRNSKKKKSFKKLQDFNKARNERDDLR